MEKRLLIIHMAMAAIVGSILFTSISVHAKPKIAVFSGPTATIQNSPPLVTGNKARAERGLPPRINPDGSPVLYDHLVPQRLAAPVEVLIEQFSGHPLEKDAAELYGPPDGYVNKTGTFYKERQSPEDKPVYRVTLKPEDGLYLLPYMALQADGKPWESSCAYRGAPPDRCRQSFYPDSSRIFEEINRTVVGRSDTGVGNELAGKADYDFYRVAPSGGFTKGLPGNERTDVGAGDIPREVSGIDFFPYGPPGIGKTPPREYLAKEANLVTKALRSGNYAGGIWLEGTPNLEENLYWLNLLIDTAVPIIGNASQRAHSMLSNDGGRNIVASIEYILSKVWADPQGRDDLGAVGIQDEQIFSARQFQKADAHPGGYRATGGYGGILGRIVDGPPTIWFRPDTLHTWKSAVNLTHLPSTVKGVRKEAGRLTEVEVKIKDDDGLLRANAIPKVTVAKVGTYSQDSAADNPNDEVEILARIEKNLTDFPLAGFIAEGLTPMGALTNSMQNAFDIAALSGMPVVRVGRGDVGGVVRIIPFDLTIEGSNLSATKAELLLMAALMKFGSLPPAADPRKPTASEIKAVQEKIRQYQEVFNTH